MIARIWRGLTSADTADAFLDYFRETGLKDFSAMSGNRGVYVLRRAIGERCEFQVVSLWESLDDIRRFTGADIERSRYYPEDERFLLEMEPLVRHFDVAAHFPDPASVR